VQVVQGGWGVSAWSPPIHTWQALVFLIVARMLRFTVLKGMQSLSCRRGRAAGVFRVNTPIGTFGGFCEVIGFTDNLWQWVLQVNYAFNWFQICCFSISLFAEYLLGLVFCERVNKRAWLTFSEHLIILYASIMYPSMYTKHFWWFWSLYISSFSLLWSFWV